jgi:ferredoxin
VESSIEIEVDRDLCVGSGNCSLRAPRTFSQEEDGLVVVGDPAASTEDELREAEDQCPASVIRLRVGS